MSVLVLLEINVKPENANDVTNFMRDELHATREFEGCNGLTVHSSQDDPNTWCWLKIGIRARTTRNTWAGAPNEGIWKS